MGVVRRPKRATASSFAAAAGRGHLRGRRLGVHQRRQVVQGAGQRLRGRRRGRGAPRPWPRASRMNRSCSSYSAGLTTTPSCTARRVVGAHVVHERDQALRVAAVGDGVRSRGGQRGGAPAGSHRHGADARTGPRRRSRAAQRDAHGRTAAAASISRTIGAGGGDGIRRRRGSAGPRRGSRRPPPARRPGWRPAPGRPGRAPAGRMPGVTTRKPAPARGADRAAPRAATRRRRPRPRPRPAGPGA